MQLFDQFSLAATQAGATVERVPRSAEQIAAAVRRAAPGAQRIAVAAPQDLPTELFRECARLQGVFVGRSKSELAAADVGITEAFAGVARTGSICITADYGDLGYVSLLSKTHIAILAAENIMERPADLFRSDCLGGKGLQRDFVFVTGPSATADMGPLVRGVHGPHHLHVIVLEAA
jgi:L-lactate dehydrogenase complex protein LldG